ncbi:MAG TPA: hypothetical protein VMW27_18220 [Thermoanaerobaculia bacterium]|nr:hypothetical protein [Thermoanaerobaculia bacterium]
MNDDDLKAVYRRGSHPLDRTDCPAADQLFAFATGAVGAPEREHLADHVAGCGACAEEVRLVRALKPWSEDMAERLGAAPRRPRSLWSRRTSFGLALAAALSLAVVGGQLLTRAHRAPVPGVPGVRGPALEDSASPPSDAVLRQPPERFVWPSQPGATGYRLRLFDEEASQLWESPMVEEPGTDLPVAERSDLRPGASYFWVVETEGQVRRRQLGPWWFRLEGR